jgi:hypothetical protein
LASRIDGDTVEQKMVFSCKQHDNPGDRTASFNSPGVVVADVSLIVVQHRTRGLADPFDVFGVGLCHDPRLIAFKSEASAGRMFMSAWLQKWGLE